jgi:hypothetical protein
MRHHRVEKLSSGDGAFVRANAPDDLKSKQTARKGAIDVEAAVVAVLGAES